MSSLVFHERPAAGTPDGLLILHHGRGSNERDLIELADDLDPERRLHVVAPGGPLTLRGWPGRHWYVVPEVGHPDPRTFGAAETALAAFHDELAGETGIGPERTVLGGFSMGAVMSYALGLGDGRPRPAGILALSGFVPTVEGFSPALAERAGMPVLIAHGRADRTIDFGFAERARAMLQDGGLTVDWRPFDGGHEVPAAELPGVAAWLQATLPAT